MPAPNAQEYNKQDEYLEVCIPFYVNEGRPHDQAVAICMSNWNKREAPEIGVLRAIESDNNGEKQLYIEGYLSVEYDPETGKPVIDEHGTNIAATSAEPAIRKVMDDFMKSGSLMYTHGKTGIYQIGKPIEYRLDNYGIWLKCRVSKPVTPERIQVYNDILDGSVRGYSIRVGAKSEVKTRVIDGEKVPYIIPDRIVEATVTAIPSNAKATFTASLRMIPEESENNKKQRSMNIKMDPLTLTKEEYRSYIENQVKVDILQSKLAENEQKLTDATSRMIEAEKQISVLMKPEKAAELEQTIRDYEEEKKEYETKLSELQRQLEEEKKRTNVTIHKAVGAIERSTQIQCDAMLDRAITELEGKPYNELIAEYIRTQVQDEKANPQKDGIQFSRQLIYMSELKKKGIDYKPEEFHMRTISTSTGIMKANEIQYMPITMDSMPSPLLAVIPKESIAAKTFQWYQRTAKSTATYDSESATTTSSDSTYGSVTGDVKYLYAGGKVSDPAQLFSPEGIKALSLEIKACQQAMKEKTEWTILFGQASVTESDAGTCTYFFDGLLKQIATASAQNYDNLSSTATLDVFDDLSDRFMSRVKVPDESGKMMSYIACDTRSFSKARKLLRALHYGYNVAEIAVGGLKYQVIHWNGAPFLRMENLIDFDTPAPTFSLAAGSYGGNVTDATWRATVSAITANGETVQATEATQATSSQGLRVTITSAAAHLWYFIYLKADGAANSCTLAKVIKNDTTAGSTFNVDFIADPTDLYLTPVRSTSYGRCIAFKVGNTDGIKLKEAANMEYVEKGRVGNYLEFYLRSYHVLIVPNSEIIVVMNIKHT